MLERADFYLLAQTDPQARWRLLTTLLSRQWPQGHQFHLHCDSAEETQTLDTLLWQQEPSSFLPHHRLDQDFSGHSPITLGYGDYWPTPQPGCILVNLAADIPPQLNHFQRVLEIVVQGEPWLSRQREHYRHYRSLGLTPQLHRLG